MRETSEDYSRIVKSSTRHIGFRCALQGERSFTVSDILDLNISRAISDGFQIGACGSDRLLLSVKATDRVEKGAKLTAFAYPEYQLNNTEPLGVFYVDEVSTENGVTTIIAYDKMNRNLDKVVLWTRSDAPAFPATQQDVLDYICALKGITCNFTCQPFVVQEKPIGYTAREIIGFIAACHAANAHFNADGELIFKQFTQTNAKIERLRCYSHTVANDSGFTVNGVLFDLGGNTQLYIDGSVSEYDEEAEGIVEVFCPFATIELAEYVWHMIGGLTYYSCTLEMPAENLLEVGDVYTTTDAQGNTVQSIVLEQELSVSADDGFKETISAAAESDGNQRSTTNRIDDLESRISSGSSGGAGAGVLTEYSVISDSVIKYNGTTYTAELADSGLISKITDDKGGEFSPTFAGGITDIILHNAAFLAVAMISGLKHATSEWNGVLTGLVHQNTEVVTEPKSFDTGITAAFDEYTIEICMQFDGIGNSSSNQSSTVFHIGMASTTSTTKIASCDYHPEAFDFNIFGHWHYDLIGDYTTFPSHKGELSTSTLVIKRTGDYSSEIKIYSNGESRDTKTEDWVQANLSDYMLLNAKDIDRTALGTVYQVRIYNRALTDTEVAQNASEDRRCYG